MTVGFVFVCVVPCHAQFWDKKEITKWTVKDCDVMVRNSPWSSRVEIGYKPPPYDDNSRNAYMHYQASILSAWTVQWAYVRMSRLLGKNKQREMTLDESKALVQQLEEKFSGTVVFRVSYIGSRGLVVSATNFWKGKPQEELRRAVTLVANGSRIEAIFVEVEPSSGDHAGGFQVVFPRQLEGRPILSSDTTGMYLEIASPLETVRLPFDVRKMMVRGELVY